MPSTGEVSPTNGTTTSESPWLDEAWVNPANITASDDADAAVTATTFDNNDQTEVLKAFAFDFSSIPDAATIDGVIVRIEAAADSVNVGIDLVQLLDTARAKVGDNKSDINQRLTTSDAVYTFGAADDPWGNALTPAWVKDADFGVAIGGHAYTANSQIFVDHVTIEVFYSLPTAYADAATRFKLVVQGYAPFSVIQRFPTSNTSDGFSQGVWTNPNNGHVDDGSDATSSVAWAANGSDSDGNIYEDFGFDSVLPSNAQIKSVKVTVESEGTLTGASAMAMTECATVGGTSQTERNFWSTPNPTHARDTTTVDITGDRAWIQDNLTDANFGIRIRAVGFDDGGVEGGAGTAAFDYVMVEVTFMGGAATRFKVSTATPAFKDAATRFKLHATGYKDAAARFRLALPSSFKDAATRFNLVAPAYKDAPTRARILTFRDKVLSLNARYYYRASEPTGSAIDIGSGGINGTYVGSPTRAVSGLLPVDTNAATQMNGPGDEINVPHDAQNNITGSAIALGIIVKGVLADNPITSFKTLTKKSNLSSSGYALVIGNFAEVTGYIFASGGTGISHYAGQRVWDGQRHLVIMRYNGSNLKVSVDGIVGNDVASVTGNIIGDASEDLHIGLDLKAVVDEAFMIAGTITDQDESDLVDLFMGEREVNRDVNTRFTVAFQGWKDAAARFHLNLPPIEYFPNTPIVPHSASRRIGKRTFDPFQHYRFQRHFQREAGGATTAFKDIATRFKLWATTFKDGSTRFKLAIGAYKDTQARFKLWVQGFKDTATRFKLGALVYKDVGTRFKLWVRGYQDAATRFRLIVQDYKDAATRFKLWAQGYKDVAARFRVAVDAEYRDAQVRFRLRATAYKDAAVRFVLDGTRGYKDVAVRFKLWVRGFQDTATRFKLEVRAYKDAATRFRLTVQAYKDAATRFKLWVQGYKDTATRFKLWVRGYKDVATRFKLWATTHKDIATRFKLQILGYKDAATRFKLWVRGFQDAATRFKLEVRAYKDIATRFRLIGRGYKDAAARFFLQVDATFRDAPTRFKLWATTYRDAATRFRLAGTLAYKDTATRFRLRVQGFRDVATRFRLRAQAYKDAATRYRLNVQAFRDIATRFKVAIGVYKDVATRYRLRAQAYRDVATRFRLWVRGFKDTATRFRVTIQGYRDASTRFRLRVLAYSDAATRFKVWISGFKDAAARFRVQGQGYKDVATRFGVFLLNSFIDARTRFKVVVGQHRDAAVRFILFVEGAHDPGVTVDVGDQPVVTVAVAGNPFVVVRNKNKPEVSNDA